MSLSREAKLEHLDRLLNSRTLQSSEALKAFLRFVVVRTVDDPDSCLKEYTIASEVFGQNNYDPRIDSVVRMHAGRLRSKLHEYYEAEGRDDSVIIDLPKGHYAPTFSYKNGQGEKAPAAVNGVRVENAAASATQVARAVPLSESSTAVAAATTAPQARLSLPLAGLLVLNVTLGAATFYYQAEARRVNQRTAVPSFQESDVQAFSPLWGGLLRPMQPILVVYSNILFERRPDLTLRSMWLLDSSATSQNGTSEDQPPSTQVAATAPLLPGVDVIDYYTGVGEVMGVTALSNFFTKTGHPFRVKRSLMLNWDDVKTENIVMLGSPAENLFLRRLPQEQDFQFRFNSELRLIEVVNLRPQAGEAKIYRPKIERVKDEGPITVSISEDYALVSLIKGPGEQNKLLILAGITTHGTHAAAEYVTRPEYLKELFARLNLSTDQAAPDLPGSFQAVLKVKVNGGVPIQVSYVTHHVLKQ